MNRTVPALLILLLIAAASCEPPPDPRLAGLPGYPAYREHCRRCHGDAGDAKRASRMVRRMVDLAAPAYRDTLTLDDVIRVVKEGKGRMKPYAEKLTAEEIEAVSRVVLAIPVRRVP